jgi:hypothetical protein
MSWIVAFAGAFLIMAALVWAVRQYTQAPPIGAERAAERARALAEVRAAELDALNQVGWIDKNKGFVRLRIEDAMKVVEREWQNPAAARSNLITRIEKATEVPPPPKAEPSIYE